jgi:hypothetical protein
MSDLDPLITEAIARVKGPTAARPSISDVHRRARRHNRRRMAATVGAVACTGVATAALIIRRDTTTQVASSGETDATGAPLGMAAPTTIYLPDVNGISPTTMVPMSTSRTIDPSFVWDVLLSLQNDPSAAGLVYPADTRDVDTMPTAEMFGCTTEECGAMFNYIVWHEIAAVMGFFDVQQMQGMNSGIDFSHLPRTGDVLQAVHSSYIEPALGQSINGETTTTLSIFGGIVLIDGGAPQGAMEDAYQRLNGYNRTIVPGAGKTVEQSEVMPIGSNEAIAAAVAGVLGIDGFDTWDPSFVAAPVEGMVAVVIGPDYFDRVQALPGPNTAFGTSTTSVG